MPTPTYFESQALRIWPYRRLLVVATVGVLLVFGVVDWLGLSFPLSDGYLFLVLSMPLCWLWGAALVAFWFHPTSGTMRLGSRWFFGLPEVLQKGIQWFGALALVLWFALPILLTAAFLATGVV